MDIQHINKDLWAYLSIALLGIGFALSPVAHVAFYYVEIISKKAYKRSKGQVCSDEDSGLINEAVPPFFPARVRDAPPGKQRH